jgi:hypothetical protein
VNLVQATGGAVAVVVGVNMMNAVGARSSVGTAVFKTISLQDSHVSLIRSRFTNCSALSLTENSLGTANVYGGAFAMLHSSEVSNFRVGILQPSSQGDSAIGSSLSILILNSDFFECFVSSDASYGRLGAANGGGGAIYAFSVALSSFRVTQCMFSSNSVAVRLADDSKVSFCFGGALAVEDSRYSGSFVFTMSSCAFFNNSVKGALSNRMAVQGGAVHVSRAARVSVTGTNFTNCSITGAIGSDSSSVISGGSSMVTTLTRNVSINQCVFDSSEGQDASGTSTGLLILSANSSGAHVLVAGSTFVSSAVVFSVRCVSNDHTGYVLDLCVTPNIILKDSKMLQLASETLPDFNATGSRLMTLQNPQFISFQKTNMRCALPQFAAFKEQTGKSSSNTMAYSCKPCLPFHISLAATEVSLEKLSNAQLVDRCFPASNTSTCPFAVKDCTTFVNVSSGFWTNISELGWLEEARRCPRGYCGCAHSINGTCRLPPLISIDTQRDTLCNGNRTGRLCGGCPVNFTQSMDGRSCISNAECAKNLWWVWTVTILAFAAFSLYIVVSCRKRADGALACLLFYFQMSSFADDTGELNTYTIFEYSQARSIVAMYEGACYAPDMSAYSATVFKLVGPLFVLLFAVAWTGIIRQLQPELQQRNVDFSATYSGTLAVTALFVFSSVSSVVFSLVECSGYSGGYAVVFIDGTVPCNDVKWQVLVFIAALLFIFPLAFAAALRFEKLSQSARDAVCSKFTGPMSYWAAVTLSFRLLISVTQFLRVDYPNMMAFVRLFLSIGVLFLLAHLRPYVHNRTLWVDVACYVCLIAQFGLQIITATRQYLGVSESSVQASFFQRVSLWIAIIRRVSALA